jgi:hypothetical protein
VFLPAWQTNDRRTRGPTEVTLSPGSSSGGNRPALYRS